MRTEYMSEKERETFAYYNVALGRKITQALSARGMNSTELGRAINESILWVRRRETGQTAITLPDILLIAQALNFPVSWFFDGIIDEPSPHNTESPGFWYGLFPQDVNLAEAHWNLHRALTRASPDRSEN